MEYYYLPDNIYSIIFLLDFKVARYSFPKLIQVFNTVA
jgi:hypothetical protein